MMPVLIAFGNLAMGELRKLDPILIPFYMNACIFIISLIVCLFSDKGFFPEELEE